MPIVASQINALEPTRVATGRHTDDAATPAAITVDVGFNPRFVQCVNLTTRVTHEWFKGMTSGHALRTVAAGTRTAETSGGISVAGDVITMPAPAQNDVVYWTVRS
jgi:hypothetical protein